MKKPQPMEPDLVDRIFEYLGAEYPALLGPRMDELKSAVRAEFRGQKVWIANRSQLERHRQAQRVLALFNGRNAREVARRLGVSRATVYRALKQAGRLDRLTNSGNETAAPVASKRIRERATEAIHDGPEAAEAPQMTITD